MTATIELTVAQAMKIAVRECAHPIRFTPEESRDWKAARKVLVAAGLCPNCACDGHRVRLGKWQPGDYHHNAGKRCPDCEEFVVCGVQTEFESAATEWRGDADPGL